MAYVVDVPIGTGSRLAGPFVSYGEARVFADEMRVPDVGVRRLVSTGLARALVESVDDSDAEFNPDMPQSTTPEGDE